MKNGLVTLLILTCTAGSFAAQTTAGNTSAPPKVLHVSPTLTKSGSVPAKGSRPRRQLSDIILMKVDFGAGVVCNAGGQMSAAMPNATLTGATWMYWYPQIFANAYNFISGAGGNLVAAGPTFARNLSTNQVYVLNANGTWRGPYADLSLVYTAAASHTYSVDDWVQFVAADGTAMAGGWFDNGYRLGYSYSGPNKSMPTNLWAYSTGACKY
jgi:hypothetical protein